MAKAKKKNYVLVVLFVLLIGISVGYAAFAQVLTINGTANANGNFSLQFTQAEIEPTIGVKNPNTSISATYDVLSISMDLEYPGAGGVVTATITNTGSIAAKLRNVTFSGLDDPNIKVSFDKAVIDEVIEPGDTKEILITVKWDENSETASKVNFSAILDYVQATTSFDEGQS